MFYTAIFIDMEKIKLGIIKERKTPPDYRVPLIPEQCKALSEHYHNASIAVEASLSRCFDNEEYVECGVEVLQDVSHCDILLGVKEVPIPNIIPGKTYLIFSHTHKKQPYNRRLLQAFIDNKCRLIDYELLTNDIGVRVIAFGHFAGLVGAHNGLLTWGKRTGRLDLDRAYNYKDLAAMLEAYKAIDIPPMKIVLTGNGRVAGGARDILDALGIKRLTPQEYLAINEPQEAVYVQLDSKDLYKRKDGEPYRNEHFYANPGMYQSTFAPYTRDTDLMINAIYWDPKAPVFFTKEDMKQPEFGIKVIADITCDIEGSVPCTLKATTIAEPFMGYDPQSEQEIAPFQPLGIDIMSIDNLPNELPRDASKAFGEQLMENVLPQLLGKEAGQMINRATICKDGKLNDGFEYLQSYLDGEA